MFAAVQPIAGAIAVYRVTERRSAGPASTARRLVFTQGSLGADGLRFPQPGDHEGPRQDQYGLFVDYLTYHRIDRDWLST